MRTAVRDLDTVSAVIEAARDGMEPCCLMFASARNIGGGYLSGARAQEESIARASGLVASQERCLDFYERHRTSRDPFYSGDVILAPHVPVFRDAANVLLEEPVSATMLVACAPNVGVMRDRGTHDEARVRSVLRERARRVTAIAAAQGSRTLILGAWGAGVFRNDPVTVARAFASALDACPAFDVVTFAIPDATSPQHLAFADAFGASRDLRQTPSCQGRRDARSSPPQ